jgi:predicted RNase H-like nuclease (RuvC/YqgF family)
MTDHYTALVAKLRNEALVFPMGEMHELLLHAARSIENLCTANDTFAALHKEKERVTAEAIAMKTWHDLACAENEQLKAKLKSMENCYSEVKDRVESFNNEDGVKALKVENERLKARQTKLIDELAQYRESISRSHERERRLRDQRDVVRDMVRLAYKTVKQD